MALAACVVEEVSGMTFDRYCEEHIFGPLEMRHASFRQPIPPDLLAVQASPPHLPHLIPYPVGGLVATPADMVRFLTAHLNGGGIGDRRILQQAAAAELQERHYSPAAGVPALAYGFFEGTINGRRVLYHAGSRSHISLACLCPEERVGFFVVVAGSPNEEVAAPVTDDFFVGFFNKFYPARGPEAKSPPSAPAPPALERFTGPYRGNEVPGTTIEKFFVGMLFSETDARVSTNPEGRLLFQPPMAEPIPLFPTGGTTFRGDDGKHDLYVHFRENPDGSVTDVTVSMAPLGVYSFSKHSWLTGQGLNAGLLFGGILVFLSWTAGVLLRATWRLVRRRGNGPEAPARARVAYRLATATAGLALVGPVWFSVWGAQTTLEQMTGIPLVFYGMPAFFTLAALVGLALPAFLVRAWRDRYWSLATRLHFTLVTLTAVGMIPYLYYWNLLGIRV
jgi:hypothetical protein